MKWISEWHEMNSMSIKFYNLGLLCVQQSFVAFNRLKNNLKMPIALPRVKFIGLVRDVSRMLTGRKDGLRHGCFASFYWVPSLTRQLHPLQTQTHTHEHEHTHKHTNASAIWFPIVTNTLSKSSGMLPFTITGREKKHSNVGTFRDWLQHIAERCM